MRTHEDSQIPDWIPVGFDCQAANSPPTPFLGFQRTLRVLLKLYLESTVRLFDHICLGRFCTGLSDFALGVMDN